MTGRGKYLYLSHLYGLLMRSRFIEVSEIYVEDEIREATFRVVIRHGTGAEESFESERKARSATFICQTYVVVIASKQI